MLAAATLLFLIALPIVDCRHRNVFSIEELGEHFSAKDYDQGKRDKGMNQAINAHSKFDRGITTTTMPCYSKATICSMLSEIVKMVSKRDSTKICGEMSKEACRCSNRQKDGKCESCLVKLASGESVSMK